MQQSNATAREMFEELMRAPRRRPFGFGSKAALVNVDLQNAYTRTDRYATAYANDPRQIEYINQLAAQQRRLGWPVIWTSLAYLPDGSDCGVWGRRSDTPDSLQNIGFGSDRARLDERVVVDPDHDVQIIKKMPSAFHGTHLSGYLVAQRVDTVIVTGGSTSGCVRATVVDAMSNGFLTVVCEACVADVHEAPHFANLYDIQAKYADVRGLDEILAWQAAAHD